MWFLHFCFIKVQSTIYIYKDKTIHCSKAGMFSFVQKLITDLETKYFLLYHQAVIP